MANTTLDFDVYSSTQEPYWLASTKKPEYPTLEEDISVDVAIVGGGMVGITSAYILKNKGLKVAIIEGHRIAQGTTGHTTAKITSQHGLIYDKLITKFSEEKAKQYANANEAAIDFIANLVQEKDIDCDFSRRPAYVYTQRDEYVKKIEKEVEAASKLGLKASYEATVPLPFQVKGAIKFADQAQFHPLKYLYKLAKEIPGDGSYIFELSKVLDIEEGETCKLLTSRGHKVTASQVIIASHFPFYDGFGMYFTKIHVEKSYVLGVKIRDKFPEGMFITAEEPGRSLRSQRYKDSEIILVGGEHHKTGSEIQTNIHYENLAKFAQESFDVQEILYRWSTQDCTTVDGLPYIGHLTSKTPNLFVATGFAKWGMTNSTVAANILADLITQGESPFAPVYDPARLNIMAAGPTLVSQNLDVAVKFVSGKISSAPQNLDIKRGEAQVIKVEGGKAGAYRDENDELFVVDITCTHLGCELVWNEAEKTWDCPCHGSRFNYKGENIEGPAFLNLKQIDEGPNKKDPNIF